MIETGLRGMCVLSLLVFAVGCAAQAEGEANEGDDAVPTVTTREHDRAEGRRGLVELWTRHR
jgi:hypothetical protein